jgi:hypothetical protein
MADTKISALTAATAAAVANELAINESGTSKKLTVSLLRDLLGVQKSVAASNHVATTVAPTEVTEMSMTLVAGTYRFSYFLIVQSATTTVGINFAINYTGTSTRITYSLRWPDTGVTAALGAVDDTANAATGQVVAHSTSRVENTTTATVSSGTAGFAVVDVDCFAVIEGVLVVSDGGDLELWHGSETATTTRVIAGSNLIVTSVA